MNRAVSGSALSPGLAIRKTMMRRQIRSVVAGNSTVLNLDLSDREIDAAALLAEEAAPLDVDSPAFMRVAASMNNAGLADAVIDGLSSSDPILRHRCLRVAGTMRMEALVTWIGPLLWAPEPGVRSAAARALGRIGGSRSADALLVAIQRLGSKPMFVIALARAAPDLYLETILRSQQKRPVHPAVAMAAGIRRRRTAIFALMAQLAGGSRRMRAVCGRALGWIDAPVSIQALNTALSDPEWRVRLSAVKALGRTSTYMPGAPLRMCLTDPNAKVLRAANDVRRRLRRR
jgi:HEAT repeat protein